MSKFRLDLSARLEDIAEKQVPGKLKPIVVISKAGSAFSSTVEIYLTIKNLVNWHTKQYFRCNQ